jgi:Fe-S oxidoreductase
MPGDAKPVSVIEDTAVNPKLLTDYISDFNQLLEQYKLSCVYHAHIGSGELHLRPILNLKAPKDVELFHTIALETAKLVKKYHGSLSGEHGDGRLRGEFIPLMIGEHNYNLLKQIKHTWDPNNIFNTGKITGAPPMNSQLRYIPGQQTHEIKTYFDFSATQGILRAAENCNGSGDCRKSQLMGGTMCPSYMATRDENTTTRARANILREFLTRSSKKNPFDHEEIYNIMDLCLSCKACKSECPSNVDMAKLKAEFLQHYYDANGVPLRTLAIAYINKINRCFSFFPWLYNAFISNKLTSALIKKAIGFASKRTIPKLANNTLTKWAKDNLPRLNSLLQNQNRKVWLFADEFTNYNDVEVGMAAIKLLHKLGYHIEIPKHIESGRTFLSKGLLRKAKAIANRNVTLLSDKVTSEIPMLGIEPSCILTFRDEYPDLVDTALRGPAKLLAKNALLIDEFLAKEIEQGNIKTEAFTKQSHQILLHGHCQQKALISIASTIKMLSLPVNYEVTEIKSGCCGMAGSFGYEKEHYDLSMKVGELVLFPEIRNATEDTIIVAPGTSCRHHIKDGTGRIARHPVEIIWEALI